jgi:hypothetical protein
MPTASQDRIDAIRRSLQGELAKAIFRHPRSFGLLIRPCLYIGVEVCHISDGEPRRDSVSCSFVL